MADLLRDYPDAKVLWTKGEEQRARTLYGAPMTRGETAREAADEFLFLYGEAFSDGPLEVDEIHEHPLKRGRVVFGYQQTVDGVPVDGSIVRVLVHDDGESAPVVTYASGHFARPPAGGVGAPKISGAEALALAMEHRAAARLVMWSEPELVVTTEGGVLSRGDALLAWKVTGWSDFRETVESFAFWVDAGSGALLRHADLIMRFTPPVSGTVTGGATPGTEPDKPDDTHRCGANPPVTVAMPRLKVEITNGSQTQVLASVFTDANGYYGFSSTSFPTDAKIRFTWEGPAWVMHQEDGAVASLPMPPAVVSLGASFPVTHDYNVNPSPFSEFDTARVNTHLGLLEAWEFMHAHLGNGQFDGLDEVALAIPNTTTYFPPCTAAWLGLTNPYRIQWGASALGTCDINYAYSTAVVHEYAHYLVGMMMEIDPVAPHLHFHEGFADTLAMLVYDVTVVAENLGTDCGPLRDPLHHDPTPLFDCNLQPQHTGGMLLSALWLELADETTGLGLASARQLFVDWAMMTSGGVADGPTACPELPKAAGPPTLLEVLTIDDDNNTLLDGTPNYQTICRIFEDRLIFAPPSLPNCGDSGRSRSCLPDTNLDGMLDVLDHLTFQNWFASGDAAADLNGDGVIDVLDFVFFNRLYKEGC